MPNKIYSFDIFDTLITRMVAKPSDIFILVQTQLQRKDDYNCIPDFIRTNFACIRKETEQFLRVNLGITKKQKDVSINDIYDAIQNNYSLTNEQIQTLLKLELEIEKKNLYPITSNINKIKELLKNGERVILISDMYLTQDMLRDILVNIDEVFKEIEIYVSNEFNCTKHDGNLYKCVKEKLGLNKCCWVHCGDNKYADVKRAKKQGINSCLYKFEPLQDYEKYAMKKTNNNISIESIIGIARYTRLCNQKQSGIYNLGCSFVGPILYGYVDWILEEALKNNTKTLHFIARDGYVLKEIADVIINEKKLDLKTKYIYGSRKAWRIPTESNYDEYIRCFFSEYTSRLSLKFLAERLNIDIDVLAKYFKDVKLNKRMSGKLRRKILSEMLENKSLKDEIIQYNLEKKNALVGYLKQELDFSQGKITFIDLNGTGKTQDILTELLSEIDENIVTDNYYFYSSKEVEKKHNSIKKTYIFSAGLTDYSIEIFSRSLDGQTLGYKYENGEYAPVTEDVNKNILISWGFEEYIKSLKDFAFNVLKFSKNLGVNLDFYLMSHIYVQYMYSHLDKNTASILGNIPYSGVGNEKNVKVCAKKMNICDAIKFFVTGKVNSEFDFISVARSGKFVNKINDFCVKYGSLRKFLINVYINKSKQEAYIRILGTKISLTNLIRR